MSDSVLILGAGFSRDAGIPVMANFVPVMQDIAARGFLRGKEVPQDDRDIIKEAMQISGELDTYHGRARLDDRNIEDILSILAFNVMGGGTKEQRKLTTFSKAIARTIDLCSKIPDPRGPEGARIVSDPPNLYRDFWKALFAWVNAGNTMPTIVTFNYDHVLELSMLQVLNNKIYNNHKRRPPCRRLTVHYGRKDRANALFTVEFAQFGIDSIEVGTVAKQVDELPEEGRHLQVNILQLHGALSIKKRNTKSNKIEFGKSVDDPYIVPPISNKISDKNIECVWREALLQLRDARSVTFVGYSLPRTDVYVQYFLRAALGPNRDLDKITVFDPYLWTDDEDMSARYRECFSEQLCRRIVFRPSQRFKDDELGSCAHFVHTLNVAPKTLLW